MFQERLDTRTFSYLKYTSTKRICKLKGNLYFIRVHGDEIYIVYIDFMTWPLLGSNGEFYKGKVP